MRINHADEHTYSLLSPNDLKLLIHLSTQTNWTESEFESLLRDVGFVDRRVACESVLFLRDLGLFFSGRDRALTRRGRHITNVHKLLARLSTQLEDQDRV